VPRSCGRRRLRSHLRRYEDRLGRALAGVINILDPQVIVLGGGLSNMQRLYRHLPTCCAPTFFPDAVDTLPCRRCMAIRRVRGAAWLWD
jgi:fructokinase